MNRKILLIILICMIIIPVVYASDVTLSLNQSEYYFKTGQDAIINMQSQNTYNHQLDGTLTYTITQSVNKAGLQYSSSNTQSTPFSVLKGNNNIPISFGTSKSPTDLDINLQFKYNTNESREVDLNNLKIHFIANKTQNNNQKQQISSSSKKSSKTNSQQSNNPFAQQQQQIQQMMNQMLGNQQKNTQNQQQNTEQKLQNNQLSQDSSALKKEMTNQIKKQQEIKKEFQKTLSQNQDFQKANQELQKEGYNLTDVNTNPINNNTGSFELNYKKPNGDKASLKGNMNNSAIQNIQKDTAESRQKTLNKIEQNKQFQKLNKDLLKQKYNQTGVKFSQEENKTSVQINYQNKNNETKTIVAKLENNTIKNISLENKKDKRNHFWKYIISLIIIITTYILFEKYYKKNKKEETNKTIKKSEKPFDYKSESKKLLEKSKKEFKNNEYKNAYGSAAQAIRLYLSWKNNLNKEITNDEIINNLRKQNKNFKEAKECFDLCSLVEFAKYKENKKDFDRIISSAQKIIN